MYKLTFLLLTITIVLGCATLTSSSKLSKPTDKFTQEQLDRTPVDVKEVIRNREIKWNAIFDDYQGCK